MNIHACYWCELCGLSVETDLQHGNDIICCTICDAIDYNNVTGFAKGIAYYCTKCAYELRHKLGKLNPHRSQKVFVFKDDDLILYREYTRIRTKKDKNKITRYMGAKNNHAIKKHLRCKSKICKRRTKYLTTKKAKHFTIDYLKRNNIDYEITNK